MKRNPFTPNGELSSLLLEVSSSSPWMPTTVALEVAFDSVLMLAFLSDAGVVSPGTTSPTAKAPLVAVAEVVKMPSLVTISSPLPASRPVAEAVLVASILTVEDSLIVALSSFAVPPLVAKLWIESRPVLSMTSSPSPVATPVTSVVAAAEAATSFLSGAPGPAVGAGCSNSRASP